MVASDSFLELANAGERCFDFCLWEYEPLVNPLDKYRSVNILFKSFEVAGVNLRILDVCQAIRQGIGSSKTVWGLKQVDGRMSWEFYFYDYKRMRREVSIPRLLDILSPFMKCGFHFSEERPYFMFSLDLDHALLEQQRDLDKINVYIGNVGSNVSSGICYSYTQAGLALDNFYFFFDAVSELEKATEKAFCSAHIDPTAVDMHEIFWPELTHCQTIVIANKKFNDGIYFSRIDVEQLLLFLRRMNYPSGLYAFVEDNRQRLDHMRYDVAFDYAMDKGAFKIIKSSLYGVF